MYVSGGFLMFTHISRYNCIVFLVTCTLCSLTPNIYDSCIWVFIIDPCGYEDKAKPKECELGQVLCENAMLII